MAQRLETAAVISRAERILFFAMLVAAVAMAAVLIRLRERAQDRMAAVQGPAEAAETVDAPASAVTLYIPNDVDNSLAGSQRDLRLPQDDSARARVLIQALLDAFRDPQSTHRIGGIMGASADNGNGVGAALHPRDIDEVYLMPEPQAPGTQSIPGKIAVVDFSAAFAQSHPSGIEPETLTLLAVIGTLHANLPAITQVRFLVDGHQQDTLAGHADLTRVYLASVTDTPGGR
ncbi:MAG: GerMN domain-containing protein [Candidatus Eremiobacteraeota bacterium]|nr:GerMN domain-containing protein [Candidatus Eremiobacteraeota bacterium]